LAAGESLKVTQAQRARFLIVPGEGFGVSHELLEGHASLSDAVFEQCPWLPVDHLAVHLLAGGLVA
jgi:hypothetical protein